LLFLVARRSGAAVALRFGLLISAASMFPFHLGFYYGEVFTALLTAVALLLVTARPLPAAFLLALAVANTPAVLPAFGLTALWLAWRLRRAVLLLLVLPAAALILGESMLKFGTPFGSPYLTDFGFQTILPYSGLPGFSYPLVFGALSILLSFGKGLLFFIPSLFVAVPRALKDRGLDPLRVEIEAMLVLLLGMLLVYSCWWSWYGGVFWGPRFFLFACIPAALASAALIGSRLYPIFAGVLAGALLFQTWGTIQSVLYGTTGLHICTANDYALEFLCWYVPEFSPLFRQFVIGFADPNRSMLPFAVWAAMAAGYLAFLSFAPAVRRAAASARSPQLGGEP
jgi:hypothetical protein